MKIIVFDTETTGLPSKALPLDQQPYVCQFAAIIFDYDFNTKEIKESRRLDILIKPKVEIPHEATGIHGISNEMVVDRPGFEGVVDEILNAFRESDVAVAHNLAFDKQLLEYELQRLGMNTRFLPEQLFDTMVSTKEYCALPGKYGGYKSPKLIELYRKIFGKAFKDAHNALYDVMATAQCLYYLMKSGFYVPEEVNQSTLF